MIYWNTEGFKYGICNVPPIGQVNYKLKQLFKALFTFMLTK